MGHRCPSNRGSKRFCRLAQRSMYLVVQPTLYLRPPSLSVSDDQRPSTWVSEWSLVIPYCNCSLESCGAGVVQQ